ncbi:DEAD/DEAH box helicase [Rhabdothermincola sp.]|mgnify:CR=1 FL=1|uniref:DEAD/DEAH box helicase n=1 Tax=Rhabdothermincola sp. TaxID=2820405 RepID=UPI002FDFF9AE
MDIFDLRQRVVDDYSKFIKGFLKIRDPRIDQFVTQELDRGLLWPEPWISLNPSFDGGVTVTDLVSEGVLRPDCERIFRIKSPEDPVGRTLALHRHQRDALDAAQSGDNYVLTTGTGSGKSLAYILPIVDEVLRMKAAGAGANQIKAIIVYPMNALANSQDNELKKFLTLGFGAGNELVTFRRYTGQEDEEQRQEVLANPPDILLTNYVMAELILTRVHEQGLIQAARGLRFLVLDELHTYRGRQGADVAFLIRRIKEACKAHDLQVIGTSATLASGNSFAEQQREIADVAS